MHDTTHNSNTEVFSIRTLIEILFKRKVILLSCLGTSLAIGISCSLLMQPVFLASSTLLLEKEAPTEKAVLLRLNQPNYDSGYEWINSEISIMQSYPVAATAFAALQDNAPMTADSIFAGTAGDLHVDKKISRFQDNLNITGGRNSNLVEINYEHASPAFAAQAVRAIVDVYIRHRAKISKESEEYRFFEQQLDAAAERLKELEARQNDFKQNQEIISPDQQHSILLSQLADFQKSLTEVRTKRISKQSRLEVLKNQMSSGTDFSIPATETSNSPSWERHIAKLKGDLFNYELELNKLKERFAVRHSDVIQLEKQIREVKLQIAREVENILQDDELAVQALQAEEKELQAAIDKIKTEIKAFSQKEFEYNQISRGISDTEEVYSMLLRQREEARISLAKLENEVRVKTISPAIVSQDPIRPKKKLYVAFALFAGSAIGLAIILVLELLDRTIMSPEDLEKYTGLTSLGAVGEIKVPVATS